MSWYCIDVQVGTVYGDLTVVREEKARNDKQGKKIRIFLCRCACGTLKVFRLGDLRSGHTRSCGCRKVELLNHRNRTHGEGGRKKTLTYSTWVSMIRRCTKKQEVSYKLYGGRGIKVCDRWRKFENFRADMGARPNGMTLDRIDNNGNYEPGNCRWATAREQNRNTRKTRFLTYDGECKPLLEWAERFGIDGDTIKARLDKLRWPVEKALTKKVRSHKPYVRNTKAVLH